MTENVMIFLGGSKRSFRCACGCNVFHKDGERHYICNSCGARYRGEPVEAPSC